MNEVTVGQRGQLWVGSSLGQPHLSPQRPQVPRWRHQGYPDTIETTLEHLRQGRIPTMPVDQRLTWGRLPKHDRA
jgi:hypothetical protein